MEDIRLAYRQDAFGNDIYCRVTWSKKASDKPRPIAMIFHGGGLIVGSAQMIPIPQIDYFNSQGFVCVIPNYRLAPQVSGKQVFEDCEWAYEWATTTLVKRLGAEHAISIDPSRVVAMGHSSGGTIALHIASLSTTPLRAVTAFYPALYKSDVSGPCHQPYTGGPFGAAPSFSPTAEDWETIKPAGQQLSEVALALPGRPMSPRSLWQMNIAKTGRWIAEIQPDGDYAALDPTTRISGSWPPTFVVAGEIDDCPGSNLTLQRRFMDQLKAAGVDDVGLEVVPQAWHMFDLAPDVGTSDVSGPRWQGVLRGLEWLVAHVN